MEKAMIASGAAWLAWKAYDYKIHRKVAPLLNGVMPGFRWAMSKIRGPVVKHQEEEGIIRLESARENSKETPMTIPKNQCGIGILNDRSELLIIGCAVRFPENMLVGPDHVLADNEEKYAVGRQGQLSLLSKPRVDLEADVVMIQLTDAEFSRIGMATTKVAAVPPVGAIVTAVNSKGMGTCQMLRKDNLIFGRVCYAGTTISGYSGAAYMAGPDLLGIHQFGGQVNGGYSASYLWCVIRFIQNNKFEDSDDWLMGQYKASNKISFKDWGLDEVVVEISGKYSMVQRQSMVKAFGSGWQNDKGYIHARDRTYDDRAQDMILEAALPAVSGESNSSKRPGDSSIADMSQDSNKSSRPDLMTVYSNLSPDYQRDFRKSLMAYDTLKKATPGQEVKISKPKNTIA